MEAADPFMIIVPPIEQFTNSYLVTTPGEEPIAFTNYINIVVEEAEVDGLRVDDKPVCVDLVITFSSSFPIFSTFSQNIIRLIFEQNNTYNETLLYKL